MKPTPRTDPWQRMIALINQGWHPFPVVASSKTPAVSTYCAGASAQPVTIEVLRTWYLDPHLHKLIVSGSIGLRMPGHHTDPIKVPCDYHRTKCGAWVMGIDIDQHHHEDPDKARHGGEQLYSTADHNKFPMLPASIVQTSIPGKTGAPEGWDHGHYLHRVCGEDIPVGECDPVRLHRGHDVEMLQPKHRHMSTGIHSSGRRYVWVHKLSRKPAFDPEGYPAVVPPVADLPQLTDEGWLEYFTTPPPPPPPAFTFTHPASTGNWEGGDRFADWNRDHPWHQYLPSRGYIAARGGWKSPNASSDLSAAINDSGRLIHWGASGAKELGIDQFLADSKTTYDQLDLEAIRRYKSTGIETRTQVLRDDNYLL